ncbi:hypothetical protein BDN72DRAFT_904882 [Pluteus cervinus]|uniref:Uncharacterized protein n=1 Tax=Pluteus cervinus TaxID=181527 RepID=A0ACD3A4F4_9AGAR|nr:hypothetical protein BDN72DRAFT_904882 [Pluteus cervinus]
MDIRYRTPSPVSSNANSGTQATPATRPSTPAHSSPDNASADICESPPSEVNRWPTAEGGPFVLREAYSPEPSKNDSIITRIGLAGHELLLMAENDTYITLFNLSEELKKEVAYLKAENAGLRFGFERLAQTCSHRCEATCVLLA